MPNYCENDLIVTGTEEEIKKFREFAKSEEKVLDENKFIPYPEWFKKLDEQAKEDPTMKDGFNSGGYDWCIKNWGTKWGICEPRIIIQREGRTKYEFKSAWSPPIPVIKAMAKGFPSLKFQLRFYERGEAFQGRIIIKNTQVLRDEQKSYSGRRGG